MKSAQRVLALTRYLCTDLLRRLHHRHHHHYQQQHDNDKQRRICKMAATVRLSALGAGTGGDVVMTTSPQRRMPLKIASQLNTLFVSWHTKCLAFITFRGIRSSPSNSASKKVFIISRLRRVPTLKIPPRKFPRFSLKNQSIYLAKKRNLSSVFLRRPKSLDCVPDLRERTTSEELTKTAVAKLAYIRPRRALLVLSFCFWYANEYTRSLTH